MLLNYFLMKKYKFKIIDWPSCQFISVLSDLLARSPSVFFSQVVRTQKSGSVTRSVTRGGKKGSTTGTSPELPLIRGACIFYTFALNHSCSGRTGAHTFHFNLHDLALFSVLWSHTSPIGVQFYIMHLLVKQTGASSIQTKLVILLKMHLICSCNRFNYSCFFLKRCSCDNSPNSQFDTCVIECGCGWGANVSLTDVSVILVCSGRNYNEIRTGTSVSSLPWASQTLVPPVRLSMTRDSSIKAR